uniref:Taste receptor type 2 n=2 Tax=Latimeria chalumnae TaxID=7897 RepID=H2ZXY6_LATCH
MAPFAAITQLVMELIIVWIGLAGNLYIMAIYVLEFRKNRTLHPSEIIMTCLASSNTFNEISQLVWFLVYLFSLCRHFGDDIYKVLDFLAVFLSAINYWFTAWLSFFYCVKIVKSKWKLFMRLKQSSSSWVAPVITGTALGCCTISFFIVFYIQIPTNTTNGETEPCKDYYIISSDYIIYSAFYSLLGCFLPLALMAVSSSVIVAFLCKHAKRMRKTTSGASTPQSGTHTAVAKTIFGLIVLYTSCVVSVLAADHVSILIESDVLIVLAYASSIYSAGSSIILTIGTVKLRRSIRRNCCLKPSKQRNEVQ